MSTYEIRRPSYKGCEEVVSVAEYIDDWLRSADDVYQGRLERQDEEIDRIRAFVAELTEILLTNGTLRPKDVEELCYGCTVQHRSIVK